MALIHKGYIKRELQSIIMLTSLISLLLACAGFVTYDFITFRRSLVRDLTTLAEMISANVQASVVFDDPAATEDTLRSLRSRRSIMAAAIYKPENHLFARYTREGVKVQFPEDPDWSYSHFQNGTLVLFHPVFFNEKPIGVLYLQSDLNSLYARLKTYLLIGLLLLLLSALVALGLSTRLQKGVSEPILELAQTAKKVSDQKNFSVRAKKYSENEIGVLASAFNQMLTQIENNDAALRKSNESLEQLNEKLEQRVQERTAALKASTDQMQVFTYSVAHDLRAPLRSMKGFSEALIEDYCRHMDEEGHEYLHRILQSANHMDALIQDLLNYSQLTREDLTFEPVDLSRIVEVVLHLLAEDIRAAKAHINVDHPLPSVIGHAATVENIIANLISNAIKYVAPNVEPDVHIYAERRGDRVTISIRDNGIGIPAEFQEKVFGVFTRLHGKEVYPGTGIGLALVRKGVERMGGRVGVQSEPGKGSRFWVELPAETAEMNERRAHVDQQHAVV